MSIWAIVPIKPLNHAKSRLAPVLSAEARQTMALEMLIYSLDVLTQCPSLAGVMVISRDTKALARARQLERVQTLQESGTPELNAALQRASKMLIAWGAEAALILPADLPLFNIEDVEQMVNLGQSPNSIVLAPDRHQDGTNAIFTRPPNLIPFSFGVGSFKMHLQHNTKAGLKVQVYESERLALDVDTPDDLTAYQAMAHQLGIDPIRFES